VLICRESSRQKALLCTNLETDPQKILLWFRYALADGSDLPGGAPASRIRDPEAVVGVGYKADYTSTLLGLFSLVTLFAYSRMTQAAGTFRRAAWYQKSYPTFANALALVRGELWANETFCGSLRETETAKVLQALMKRLTNAVCYAA
jgi:hypothetical protein